MIVSIIRVQKVRVILCAAKPSRMLHTVNHNATEAPQNRLSNIVDDDVRYMGLVASEPDLACANNKRAD